MGFREKSFAKVWKLENKGNYHVAEMSVSKKNKDTGVYEVEWQNKFVRLVGTAHKQAESLKDGDSVKIGACDVTNKYDKDKKTTYTNYVIFGFEDLESSSSNASATKKPIPSKSETDEGFIPIDESLNDDDLPF